MPRITAPTPASGASTTTTAALALPGFTPRETKILAAAFVSMNQSGKIDFDKMGEIMGIKRASARAAFTATKKKASGMYPDFAAWMGVPGPDDVAVATAVAAGNFAAGSAAGSAPSSGSSGPSGSTPTASVPAGSATTASGSSASDPIAPKPRHTAVPVPGFARATRSSTRRAKDTVNIRPDAIIATGPSKKGIEANENDHQTRAKTTGPKPPTTIKEAAADVSIIASAVAVVLSRKRSRLSIDEAAIEAPASKKARVHVDDDNESIDLGEFDSSSVGSESDIESDLHLDAVKDVPAEASASRKAKSDNDDDESIVLGSEDSSTASSEIGGEFDLDIVAVEDVPAEFTASQKARVEDDSESIDLGSEDSSTDNSESDIGINVVAISKKRRAVDDAPVKAPAFKKARVDVDENVVLGNVNSSTVRIESDIDIDVAAINGKESLRKSAVPVTKKAIRKAKLAASPPNIQQEARELSLFSSPIAASTPKPTPQGPTIAVAPTWPSTFTPINSSTFSPATASTPKPPAQDPEETPSWLPTFTPINKPRNSSTPVNMGSSLLSAVADVKVERESTPYKSRLRDRRGASKGY